MQATIGERTVKLSVGDITQEKTDAIVNAANRRLYGGSGLDAAILKAAGSEVMKETRTKYPKGCPVGYAVISRAGFLQAQYLIHAVGPLWVDGKSGEADDLRYAYLKCLELAADYSCMSIAFPAISTGGNGFPLKLAAEVAFEAVRDFEHESEWPSEIRFILYTTEIMKHFEDALQRTIGFHIVSS